MTIVIIIIANPRFSLDLCATNWKHLLQMGKKKEGSLSLRWDVEYIFMDMFWFFFFIFSCDDIVFNFYLASRGNSHHYFNSIFVGTAKKN